MSVLEFSVHAVFLAHPLLEHPPELTPGDTPRMGNTHLRIMGYV